MSRIACIALCASLLGCSQTPEQKDYSRPLPEGVSALVRVAPEDWPDFTGTIGDGRALRESVANSLSFMSKPSSHKYFPIAGLSHERVLASLLRFSQLLDAGLSSTELERALRREFELYSSRGWDGSGEVLFTAYCEPIYRGSRTRDATYRYPLYKLPPDLVKDERGKILGRRTDQGLVPYYTRKQLETSGHLRGLELCYLADPFDAFVVHVQGSARIRLVEGGELRVGYAGKNGRAYTSVGKRLVAEGAISADRISLQAIREHFRAHPENLRQTLWCNESFVFFTETSGGPYGSLGVPVTPERSLATDRSIFPPACICFVDTEVPSEATVRRGKPRFEPFRGFLCDQDTGGAIRSAGRADLFLGAGTVAERRAGHTKQEGRLYYLVVRSELVAEVGRRTKAGL